MRIVLATFVCFFAFPASPKSQEPATTASREAVYARGLWRVPIHGAPADPELGGYGLWAAGDDYKASFHDGFCFVPLLGVAAPANQPWRWRTTDVRVGGVDLLRAEKTPDPWVSADGWRCEYRFGAVTEVYDVVEAGVEQSFVLHDRPGVAGDLTIAGRVGSALRGVERGFEHAAIEFFEAESRALVRYGEALAIDAVGRRIEVPTAFDGVSIRLRVDGAWLDEAAFPVIVDPLVSRTRLLALVGPAAALDVCAFSDRFQNRPIVFTHTRAFSATDLDGYAFSMNANLMGQTTVWTDVTSSWSTERPRCAWEQQARMFAIAFERRTANLSTVRMYRHPLNGVGPNVGPTHFLNLPTGFERNPDVACIATGGPMVVFELSASASGGTARCFATRLDVGSGQFGSPVPLRPLGAGGLDQVDPTIGGSTSAGDGFITAWRERSSAAGDDWDLRVNPMSASGTMRSVIGIEAGPASSPALDALAPRIEGENGRYLLAYRSVGRRFLSSAVESQRFDWSRRMATPVLGSRTALASAVGPSSTNRLLGLAFDPGTGSHWSAVVQRGGTVDALRLGGRGGIVESRTIDTVAPAFAADPAAVVSFEDGFVVVHADTNLDLVGHILSYGASRLATFGASCAPNTALGGARRPHSGDIDFSLLARTGAPNAACVLLASGTAALNPVALPGTPCALYIGGATPIFQVAAMGTDVLGDARFSLPIADLFQPTFDLSCQAAWLAPGANALGVLLSNGVTLEVR